MPASTPEWVFFTGLVVALLALAVIGVVGAVVEVFRAR